MTAFAPTLQAFFTQYLIGQRQASPHTVSAYRDTFRLLLTYIADRGGTPPARLDFDDLDATTISAFLTHLEHDRGVSAATRNARLAAVRSLSERCCTGSICPNSPAPGGPASTASGMASPSRRCATGTPQEPM